MQNYGWIGRRELVRLLGVGGAALAAGLPARVHAAAAKNTLVLGLDISDTISFDPAREAQYTPPLTVTAAYESLVTMTPGEYTNVKPALANVLGTHAGRQGLAIHAARRGEVQQRQAGHGRGREVVARPGDAGEGSAVAVSTATSTTSRSSTRRRIDVIMKNPGAPI